MGYRIRLTFIAIALSLWGAGCIATEKWTRDLVRKREAHIEDRVVNVETRVREQRDRLEKVEVRVTELESRSDRRAATTQKESSAATRSTARRTLVAVIQVPFAFDRADLDPRAEVALATIVAELRDSPQMTIDLEGTTDPVGSLEYNVKLSQRRVEAVKRGLVEKGVEPERIISSAARGPLVNSSLNNKLKRRVMVKLMKISD